MDPCVLKGPVLHRLDRFCALRANVEDLAEQLGAAASPAALLSVHSRAEGPLLRAEEREVLERHWFPEARAAPPGEGFWPRLRPIWAIVRDGLFQACRLSLAHAQAPEVCPLDFYWVAAGDDVRVVSCLAPERRRHEVELVRQVTVLILTPPAPAAAAFDTTRVEPIYLTRRSGVGAGEHVPGRRPRETVTVQPYWPLPRARR